METPFDSPPLSSALLGLEVSYLRKPVTCTSYDVYAGAESDLLRLPATPEHTARMEAFVKQTRARKLPDLVGAFQAKGGKVLFLPSEEELRAGPPLAVCVRDDDVCVPVCKDGIGMSQVMYLVCHGMKRGLPTHRVCVPHGAVEGFDPHTAFAPPLDEGSVFEYMFQAMLPRGAVPVEWSAEAFFKQFGVDRARRAGEVTAALNNIELNPADFTKHNPAVLSKLSKQRTQQRRAMDALVYDVAALNRYRGPGGRLIIIAFTKSVSVYLSRLLEVSGSKDMSGVCLIACPYEDASRAAGALPAKERDAAAASAFLAAYTLLGNVFVSLRTAGRPEFNARLAFDMAGQLRMIEEATARLRGLCPTLDTPMLNSAMGGGGFAAAGGFNTPLMAVSRLPPECILARETVQFRDKLSHGSHSIILRALYLGQPVVVKSLRALVEDTASLRPDDVSRLREALMTQAIALSGIRHTNIAQFYGVLMAGDGSGIEWIVSELADASSLKTFIRSSVDAHTPLEVDMLLSFAKYMMRGLTYLHTKSPAIIHGHVKPSNCLLFLSFGGGMTLKLSMAMDEAEGVGASRSSDAVYDAPEAADGEQSSKSDVFSVGVVLCEMVYSLLRVGPRDLARDRTGYLADAIMALRPLSPSLADVIQACTVPSVAARCDSLEALERLESIRSTVSVSRALRAAAVACPYYEVCSRFIRSLNLPDDFLNWDIGPSLCYCPTCTSTRGEERVSTRGSPPCKYVLPYGWMRVGLRVGGTQAAGVGAFDNWHVAYHGTRVGSVKGILRTGVLVKAGDTVLDGHRIGIRDGHITRAAPRLNRYTGQQEMFDPNQIFVSPVIEYSALEAYAASAVWEDPVSRSSFRTQAVFQLRIRPTTYAIGQETVNAKSPIDPTGTYNNDALEWYTTGEERGAILLTALLVRCVPV